MTSMPLAAMWWRKPHSSVSIDLDLTRRPGAAAAQDFQDDAVVVGAVPGPVDLDAVRLRGRLELLEIAVEMAERVGLDLRREVPQRLPFGDAVRGDVALLAQIPEALVVGGLMQRRGEEALGRLGLIDRPVAADLGAPRLGLADLRRADRLRGGLGVLEAAAVLRTLALVVAGPHFRVDDALALARVQILDAHAAAPFSTCAMWMYFSGKPRRSAQPFWCIRHEESADTTYWAPARF